MNVLTCFIQKALLIISNDHDQDAPYSLPQIVVAAHIYPISSVMPGVLKEPKKGIYQFDAISDYLLPGISPEDIQWEGEEPGISHQGGYGRSGHAMNRSIGRDSIPAAGRGRGVSKGQSRKDFPPSQNGIGKKGSDEIQLLHTDTLLKEVMESNLVDASISKFLFSYSFSLSCELGQVEKVFSAGLLDPVEIEKAKKVLKVRKNNHAVWYIVLTLSSACRTRFKGFCGAGA
ncbi:unnamed protein product [Ilex paraguariensis]|uniref:Uncharacterized protein n=1 Tax=Ilex paraguariensis TaxID=185542 RepID=A0ABC8RYS6_9AQUA